MHSILLLHWGPCCSSPHCTAYCHYCFFPVLPLLACDFPALMDAAERLLFARGGGSEGKAGRGFSGVLLSTHTLSPKKLASTAIGHQAPS
eukprot:736982-Pelagomonas_calceolata.AAC.1